MNSKEYIESGILELYVFGTLSEQEMEEVNQMATQHTEVKDEITAIERAVINLSYGIAPHLSAANFDKIRNQLLDKQKVVQLQPKAPWTQYMGWAAAAVFVLGMGVQFYKLNESNSIIDNLAVERTKLQESVVDLELKNKESDEVLAVLRDNGSVSVALAGQQVNPDAYAKAYYNKTTKSVYIDASGLPEPPKGMVYQVWALQLEPVLTPTSIGLLDTYASSTTKVIKVDNAEAPQAFGITLEPAGGSAGPTMEQLYTLGKV
ncbi:anti-sigma factor domain-containing protein [Flavobacterium ardleyense]|uniref:Anti-sigma factor domain-containing protein n=1 Tax=Flavobacterium ardleyense TaxID=2038737 RepID=A0ABW5ZBG4_9FLAO